MTTRKFAFAAFAVAATLAASLSSGGAQARGPVDVQWQVTIGSPGGGYPARSPVYYPEPVYLPAPVYRPAPVYVPAPVYLPAPVVVLPGYDYRDGPVYREPRHWDADGDGIPNRHDRVYNPRWDRDGDGYRDHHGHHGRSQRESREDRDDRRKDRHDDRRDWRQDRHR